MITVYVKLMGSLLSCSPAGESGLIQISLRDGSVIREAIQALGIPMDRVKLILINHAAAQLNQPLEEGDKVSLFPLEYPVFPDWKGFIKRH